MKAPLILFSNQSLKACVAFKARVGLHKLRQNKVGFQVESAVILFSTQSLKACVCFQKAMVGLGLHPRPPHQATTLRSCAMRSLASLEKASEKGSM